MDHGPSCPANPPELRLIGQGPITPKEQPAAADINRFNPHNRPCASCGKTRFKDEGPCPWCGHVTFVEPTATNRKPGVWVPITVVVLLLALLVFYPDWLL
jgi:hypothetical protein